MQDESVINNLSSESTQQVNNSQSGFGLTAAIITGAIISAVGALGSSIGGAVASKKQQKRANEYNRQQMERQYELELEQQKYQNEYNSPLNQRNRLLQAGYNPWQGIESYQSADAAAPEPIPYQEMDYAAHSQNIGDRVSGLLGALSNAQELRYQKLKTDEQAIINKFLPQLQENKQWQGLASIDNQLEGNYLQHIKKYNELVKSGVNPGWARKYVFGDDSLEVENFVGSGIAEFMLDSAENNAKKSKWAAKQTKLGYQDLVNTQSDRYQSLKLANYRTEAETYDLGQKLNFLKETSRLIDKCKIDDYTKSMLKFAAQTAVYNNDYLMETLNPIEFVKSLVGKKLGAAKNFINKNYNFKSKNVIVNE